jgi:hypothetical protein
MKEQLINAVTKDLVSTINKGDLTTLEEILSFVPDKNLVWALPEDQWSKYSDFLPKNKLVIYKDNIESPRTWDNVGIIAYKHRQYNIGEEKIDIDPIDWLESILVEEQEGIYTNERLAELEEKFFSTFIALPVYMRDHSGISLSTTSFNDRWDSGKVGYIYTTLDKVKEIGRGEEWLNGRTLEEATKDVLEGEIKTFNQWLEGDVYGYIIESEEGDIEDACGGYYGTDFLTNGMFDSIDRNLLNNISTEALKTLLKETNI